MNQPPTRSRQPDWRRPPGVTTGAWGYVNEWTIADHYDALVAGTPPCQLDQQIVAAHFPPILYATDSLILDLGCGSGRMAVVLAERGYQIVGVDLSQRMLQVMWFHCRCRSILLKGLRNCYIGKQAKQTRSLMEAPMARTSKMNVRLSRLAMMVDGQLIDGQQLGHANAICDGAFPLGEESEHQITLLDDPRRNKQLALSPAIAVVTSGPLDSIPMAQIVVSDPRAAFTKIVSFFRPPLQCDLPGWGIDPSATLDETAYVHPSAVIGANVTIGARTRVMPGVVIMPECRIGNDCILHPGVTLYEYTEIGDRVVIHAQSVIGANGFGYRQENGRHIPTAQLGYVQIDSDVELGALVTVDRATYGKTHIGEGTKIDNQVMVAHNCKIGRHNLLCSQVGVAGSCTTGDYVILAGQVGLKDHINLGDHTIVGAQAGVMEDCPGNQVYLGSPATPQREQMQIMAVERRLPEMRRELKTLRRDVDRVMTQQASSPQQPESPVTKVISIEHPKKRAA